jgi:tetraacyldisaccharide 4'-kinase
MRPQSRIAKLWRPQLSALDWPLWAALMPLSTLYGVALEVRSRWWRGRAQSAPVPTIGVGNLTVGGNGKTPFALFLAERLRRRGYRIAIVSRGYGRRSASQGAALVADCGKFLVDAAAAGDEPAMMAHAFDGPIAVARRRIDAIKLLTDRAPLDAIVLDDAFQHQRLRRDVDLVLIAATRSTGNGWLLPAGPLREPLSALDRASVVIMVSRESSELVQLSPDLRAALATKTVLHATVKPRAMVRSWQGAWTESALDLIGRRIVAVSGLADPEGFSLMLRNRGAIVTKTLEYPDHHRYSAVDWRRILNAAESAELVVTTEKDLVKLERFSPALVTLYALRLEVVMDEADELALLKLVSTCLENRRLAAKCVLSKGAPGSRCRQ